MEDVNISNLSLLYFVIVRPHLDYALQASVPYVQKDAAAYDEMCEEIKKASTSRTPPRIQTSLDAATYSSRFPHLGVEAIPWSPELICG